MNNKADIFASRIKAHKLITKYAISNPREIVLEDIAMAEGVLVQEGALDGAEARLLKKGNRAIIRVKESIPEVSRKRFAIAHELGHWQIHKEISQLHLCTELDFQEIQEYKNSFTEVEANTFASILLLPTPLLRPVCEDATPSIEVIKTIAKDFNTSLMATAIRFVEECRETCIVVFSEQGKIKWFKAKENNRFWIETKTMVNNNTSAWQCVKGSINQNKMEVTSPEFWFSQVSRSQVEVYEQSIRLGRYQTILTLLWIIEN